MNPFHHRLATDIPLIEMGVLTAMISAKFEPFAAEHPGMAQMRQKLKPQCTMLDGGICCIPVEGVLARKPDPYEMAFCGVEDSAAVQKLIEDATADPSVRGILLNVDSPGGMVTGGLEVADAVAKAGKSKAVVAYTGGMAASMGYYIASQASQVVATRSAVVGSIGCVISFFNYAKMLADAGITQHVFTNADATLKGAGAPGIALTDSQKAYFQARVDAAAKDFHSAVARTRGSLPDEAKTGAVFYAEEAKKMGLIDRVGSHSFALGVLKKEMRARG
jgi:signal peptide peptidase SppA